MSSSRALARLGLRAASARAMPLPLPLASRVGVRAFSVSAARKWENKLPTDKYGVPDYSKGPSALDKASQLFFFTEIVRGEYRCGVVALACVDGSLGSGDRVQSLRSG